MFHLASGIALPKQKNVAAGLHVQLLESVETLYKCTYLYSYACFYALVLKTKSILRNSKGIFQRFAFLAFFLTYVKDIFDCAEEKSCYGDFRVAK